MIGKLWIAAAMVLAGWAIPAQAADVATLDCIVNELPASARAMIVEEGRRSAASVDQRGPGFDDAMTAYRAALALCTNRHKWNAAAADAASKYTVSVFILEGVMKAASGEGIQLDLIEKALSELTDEQRAQILERSGGFEVLVEALVRNGFEIKPEGDQAQMVGAVTGAILTRDASRAEFIAS